MVFNKELKHLKYWAHLAIISTIVLGILQYFKGGDMLTFMNVIYSIPLLALGDIIAHNVLGLD